MTIRAIMVDVDGVLVVHPDPRGWSVHLERDLGVAASVLRPAFFDRHRDDVIHGRAGLRERLEPVLLSVAPGTSYETLTRYWFANDAHVNDALLAELASLRAEGIEVHLATVQEYERARYLRDELDFRERFDGLHDAAALGCGKPSLDFYRHILARTGFAPEELFFIDDRLENVEAAAAIGWRAAVWTGQETLRSLMHQRCPSDLPASGRSDIAD